MYVMGFFGNKNSEKLEEYEKKMEKEKYQKWKQDKEDKEKKYQEGANISYEKWKKNKPFNYSNDRTIDDMQINDIVIKDDVDIGQKPRRIEDVNDVDTTKVGYPSQSAHSIKWDTNEKIDSDLTKDKNQDAIDRGQ